MKNFHESERDMAACLKHRMRGRGAVNQSNSTVVLRNHTRYSWPSRRCCRMRQTGRLHRRPFPTRPPCRQDLLLLVRERGVVAPQSSTRLLLQGSLPASSRDGRLKSIFGKASLRLPVAPVILSRPQGTKTALRWRWGRRQRISIDGTGRRTGSFVRRVFRRASSPVDTGYALCCSGHFLVHGYEPL